MTYDDGGPEGPGFDDQPAEPLRSAGGSHRRAPGPAVIRRRRVVIALLGVAVLVVLAFGLWYELESHALGAEGPEVIVSIHSGESVSQLAGSLSGEHVIGSTLAFRIFDLVHGTPTLQTGSYAFHQNQSFSAVHALLAAGPNVFTVNVLRGLTLHEVASRVDDLPGHASGSFAQIAASGVVHSIYGAAGSNNLEGLLGTGTYVIRPGESDLTILTDMVQRFEHQAESSGLTTTSAAALGMTPYQLVTVASVVEKEGYIDKNMPDVARVVYNRLTAGTPLQMDSTVLYSLGQDGGPVTPQDLKIVSPYNSYLNRGLPPTPICIPSPDALAAAVHPPAGPWLFFVVVKADGTEAFAVTFAEQQANERLAQARGVG